MSFEINRVYTRSGDLGETSLVDGSRVSKNSLRCKAFGDLDELNSFIGLCKEEAKVNLLSHELINYLEYLQQELFDLGAELATPSAFTYPTKWIVNHNHVLHLEKLCDHFNQPLPPLSSFILPGGNKLCSLLHIARAVARRTERSIIDLFEKETDMNEEIIKYVNRFSDLMFVLARYALHILGDSAPLWTREEDRASPLK